MDRDRAYEELLQTNSRLADLVDHLSDELRACDERHEALIGALRPMFHSVQGGNTAISGHLELLRDEGGFDTQTLEMLTFLDDLLSYSSKALAGPMHLTRHSSHRAREPRTDVGVAAKAVIEALRARQVVAFVEPSRPHRAVIDAAVLQAYTERVIRFLLDYIGCPGVTVTVRQVPRDRAHHYSTPVHRLRFEAPIVFGKRIGEYPNWHELPRLDAPGSEVLVVTGGRLASTVQVDVWLPADQGSL